MNVEKLYRGGRWKETFFRDIAIVPFIVVYLHGMINNDEQNDCDLVRNLAIFTTLLRFYIIIK